MKPHHLLMTVGLSIAAWLAIFGDKTPSDTIAEPVARPSKNTVAPVANAVPASNNGPAKKIERDLVILSLKPRDELIGGAHGGSAKLFDSQSWMPPPPPPPKPLPPPPPTAPPLPFTYLGKKMEDGAWEIYLARGDQTLVVREKTTIDNTYRVDSVTPPTLSLTYLPLNQVQTLSIGGND